MAEALIVVVLIVVALCFRSTNREIAYQGKLTRHFINQTRETLMSVIGDKIAEVGQAVSDLEASDSASTQAVLDAIARLEAKIAEGGASQADLDALDSLKARVAVLKQAEDDQKARADSEQP